MLYKDLAVLGFAFTLGAVYLFMAFYAWERRSIPGAAALAVILLGAGEYAVLYVLGLASPNLATAMLLYNLSLPGASILGPAWFVFSMEFSQLGWKLTPRKALLLGLIPAATCLMAWTNPLHQLYGSHFQFNPQAAWPVLEWRFGLFYWINFVYAYAMTAAGMLVVIRVAVLRMRVFTQQATLLMVGTLVPILLNVFFAVGFTPIPRMDVAPFSFLLTGLIWSLAVFRFGLLDIVPVARERVFESMPVGMIVLDAHQRVVDINQQAVSLLSGPDRSAPGGLPSANRIGQVLPGDLLCWLTGYTSLEEMSARAADRQEISQEVEVGEGAAHRHLNVNASPVLDSHNRHTGQLILIYDITRQKQAELAERQQRTLAEAMSDTLSDLNQSLSMEDVLDLILRNLRRICPYDQAHVVVVDLKSRIAVQRWQDYSQAVQPGSPAALDPLPCLDEIMALSREPHTNLLQPICGAVLDSCRACPRQDGMHSSIAVPFTVYNRLAGVVVADSTSPDAYSQAMLPGVSTFVDQAAIAIENVRLYTELQELSMHDELTGLFNRRGLMERARVEIRRANRFDHPLGMVLFDLDSFKKLNDTYGHPAGDQVLREVAKRSTEQVRDIDILGRYGGDEFVVLLPEISPQSAVAVGERLRMAINAKPFQLGSEEVRVTASLGVVVSFHGTWSLEEMLKNADQAMYAAKHAGRDCVRAALCD